MNIKPNVLFLRLTFCLLLLTANSVAEKTSKAKTKNTYQKFEKAQEQAITGLFKIYPIEDKHFFELNDSLLGREFLLASRVSEISNTSKGYQAGRMTCPPLHFELSRDDKYIHFLQPVTNIVIDPNDPIAKAVNRNSIKPILYSFKIESFNSDSTAVVADLTRFLSDLIGPISPFGTKKPGKLEKVATYIKSVKAFEKNVEIKTQLNFSSTKGRPFLTTLNRSFLLLPKETMPIRLQDKRVGYFTSARKVFSSQKIGVDKEYFINRFDLRPRPEDLAKHKAGELVVPEKQIIFYYDDAFPKAWQPYVKAGIEDWQKAFEAIGFKDAIIGKVYPNDNPTFDPDDIRYSCVRYIGDEMSNSMGPRFIDPRSGEVLGGDVIWWHNVTSVLRNWRFTQCAAVDPKARERHLNTEMLGEMVRYVAAHELGHCLGLQHNMRASYAFPVDSLRSGKFTQENGTTPSIMDYARFNYVAQPGDKNIRFTPPHMGPYDIFAIAYGYKVVYQANSPKEEQAVLSPWVTEKYLDPIYRFGESQMAPSTDPASQTEAIGDNPVLASTYGVKNARYIMNHLVEWTTEPNGDYEYLKEMYTEVKKQYNRYLGHVTSVLGGVYIYQRVEGDDFPVETPVEKAEQKEALAWLFNELRTQSSWIINKDIEDRLGPQKVDLFKLQSITLDKLMGSIIMRRLEMHPETYSSQEYIDDMFHEVWKKTIEKEDLNQFDRHLQASYVRNLLSLSNLKTGNSSSSSKLSDSHFLTPTKSSKIDFTENTVQPLIFQKMIESKKLLKKHIKNSNPILKAHYNYLYNML